MMDYIVALGIGVAVFVSNMVFFVHGYKKGRSEAVHLTQQRIMQERIKGWNDCAEDVTRKLREAGIEVIENRIEAEDAARTVH